MASLIVPGALAGLSMLAPLFQQDEQQENIDIFTGGQKRFLEGILPSLGSRPSLNQNPLFQQATGLLQNILSGNPDAFKAFEAPYMRQFQNEIMPGIAERFAGLNGLSSSAFQQQSAGAGRQLTENLAALRGQMQLSALGPAMQAAQMPGQEWWQQAATGLMPQFQPGMRQGSPGGLAQTLAPILQGYGTGIGQASGQNLTNSLKTQYPSMFGGP